MPIIILFVIAFFLLKDSKNEASATSTVAGDKPKPVSKPVDPLLGFNAPKVSDTKPAFPVSPPLTNTMQSSSGGALNTLRMAQIETMANENFSYWMSLGNDKPKLIYNNLLKVIDLMKLENFLWNSGTTEVIRAQIVGTKGKYSILEFSGKHAGILPIDKKDIYLKILIDEEFVRQMGITAWSQLKTKFPTSFIEYLKFLVRK